MRKLELLGVFLAGLVLLAACNFNSEEETPQVTASATALAVVPTLPAATTPAVPTLTTEPTRPHVGIITSTASNTPFTLPSVPPTTAVPVGVPPTFTPAPLISPQPPTSTIPPTATVTTAAPVATATLPPGVLPTLGAPPTFTPSGFYPTALPFGTATPTPTPLIASTMITPPPTFTPFVIPSSTAITAGAYVCSDCDFLRLRDAPGLSANVLRELEPGIPLYVVGRVADNSWIQVTTDDGLTGWVAAQYLTLAIDLNLVSVTGQALPTAVADAGGAMVSGISSHARQIFLDGLAKGNKGHAFTKVGDSITASPNFLVPIGYGQYSLGSYGYLSTAINFFSGPNGRGENPFLAGSMAARNSWGTTSVLSPSNADSGICRAGETPLACEYRVNRPSVALIMFGTNDSGGLPSDQFRANLQTIVQTSINMGVIPVLSTIPAKHYNPATDGRVAEFNQIIISVARTYDIPLWDYGAAMSKLPGEGLAADGVHPSTPPNGMSGYLTGENLNYGYPMRNLGALMVLYSLWQQILYDADTAIPATQPPSMATQSSGGTGTYTCPGAPVPQLTVGGQGQVTPGLPNKVRSSPGFSASQVGAIPGEGVFSVIGGPSCADGYNWWQVSYEGLTGWTADGDSSEYWVKPYP